MLQRAFAVAVTMMSALCLVLDVEAQDAGPVIVVRTAENPADYHSATIGNALADMLIGSLSSTGTLTIVDARHPYRGAATLYLSAKVTDFSYQERAIEALASGAVAMYEQSTTVRIDITAVDDRDQIAFTEAVEHSETTTSATAMMGGYEYLLSSSVSMLAMANSMMGRATEMAVERAADRVTRYLELLGPPALAADTVEGQVIAIVDAKTGIIDKGRAAGIRERDELEVLRGQPIANDAGSVVFARRVNVGMATVSEAQDDGALIVATTAGEIREGDFFRRTLPSAAVSERIAKGTAFLNAAFFHAAAREYRAARELDSESLEAHYLLGLAYMKTDNAVAAFESFSWFLDAGAPLELAVTHQHILGSCTGTLRLTRDAVAYRSPGENRGDHWFDVPLAEVLAQRVRADGDLVLRAASAEQAEKNEDQSQAGTADETKNWAFRLHLMGAHEQLADIIVTYIDARR